MLSMRSVIVSEEKAKNIVSSYSDDLEDTLVAELIQFAAFVRIRNIYVDGAPTCRSRPDSPE